MMKCSTDSVIALYHNPVAVHRELGRTTAVVDDATPHLKPEEGKSENEEHVEDEDVAQLLERLEEGGDEDAHRWEGGEASQWPEQSEGPQGGDIAHSWNRLNQRCDDHDEIKPVPTVSEITFFMEDHALRYDFSGTLHGKEYREVELRVVRHFVAEWLLSFVPDPPCVIYHSKEE